MSGILGPFEGSGDLLTPDYVITSSTVTPTTTVMAQLSGSPLPSSVAIVSTNSTSTMSYATSMALYTSTAVQTVLVQDNHSNTSVHTRGFPLSLWALAVLVVGTTILLSVTLICVTLLVGWRKAKRRKAKRRRHGQVDLRTQRSHHGSNLWIDLESQEKEKESTDNRLEMKLGTRQDHGYDVNRRYTPYNYGFNTLPVVRGNVGISSRNPLRLNNEDTMLCDVGVDSSPTRRSQSLPRRRMHRPRVNRQNSFLHLQPATMSTFKLDTPEEHTQTPDYHNTSTCIDIDRTPRPALHLNPTMANAATSTGTGTHSPEKIDISDIPSLNLIKDCEHQLEPAPAIDLPVGVGFLATANQNETSDEDIEINELPPIFPVVNLDNYHNGNDDFSVTTFAHYAFNTL